MDFPLLIRVMLPFHFVMVMLFDADAKDTTASTQNFLNTNLSCIVIMMFVWFPELFKIGHRELYDRWTGTALATWAMTVGSMQWLVALVQYQTNPHDLRRPTQLYILIGFAVCCVVLMATGLVVTCRRREELLLSSVNDVRMV